MGTVACPQFQRARNPFQEYNFIFLFFFEGGTSGMYLHLPCDHIVSSKSDKMARGVAIFANCGPMMDLAWTLFCIGKKYHQNSRVVMGV